MVLLYYLRHLLKPEIYGPGYRGMFKQGFYEVPYVTVACIAFPFPFLLFPFICWRDEKLDAQKKRYLVKYTVMRPDDSRREYFHMYVDRTKKSEV